MILCTIHYCILAQSSTEMAAAFITSSPAHVKAGEEKQMVMVKHLLPEDKTRDPKRGDTQRRSTRTVSETCTSASISVQRYAEEQAKLTADRPLRRNAQCSCVI
mmetsp:Transcript_10745/g.29659  ORF Transcript_10745/g.29659 Transcript_10745/m.29659 type:complete len:104 (-) Transcript_10745:568-879(-)